jgi:hypothetical protein
VIAVRTQVSKKKDVICIVIAFGVSYTEPLITTADPAGREAIGSGRDQENLTSATETGDWSVCVVGWIPIIGHAKQLPPQALQRRRYQRKVHRWHQQRRYQRLTHRQRMYQRRTHQRHPVQIAMTTPITQRIHAILSVIHASVCKPENNATTIMVVL